MKFYNLPLRKKLFNPIKDLAEDGKLSGILLILATIFSIILSNCAYAHGYLRLWHSEIGPVFLSKSVVHWINEGLMPIFFLLVGIEIKREMVSGELSQFRQAILPAFAALGGMAVPAIIYFIFNSGNPETIHGWAIPTATDIAFSLGLVSLLGKRVPFSIKIFLTALAIIDDLGAIVIIGLFYSNNIEFIMLLMVVICFILLLMMNRLKVKMIFPYLLAGAVLWYFVMRSGIHPTIAGVILALTIPGFFAERLEEKLTKPVYYLILPLFALANTAIPLTFDIASNLFSPMSLGIILGLVIGKPLGIIIFSYALVKSKVSEMLTGITWSQMIGVGMIAGIGFTMSIFLASLSFQADLLSDTSKLAIMAGSLVSALAGFFVLWKSLKAKTK